ncbi:zinc finger protein 134-like [Clytia hemisphaerica]|uniref:C2H2-type domain-containing protein n=1 Tax=Clytia hemisphaerica TaxID=252671 RepID=A0A7M5V402_9CNID
MNFEFGDISIKFPVKVGCEESISPIELCFNIKCNGNNIGLFRLTLESFDTSLELKDLGQNSLVFKPSIWACQRENDGETRKLLVGNANEVLQGNTGHEHSIKKNCPQTCHNEQENNSSLFEPLEEGNRDEIEVYEGSSTAYNEIIHGDDIVYVEPMQLVDEEDLDQQNYREQTEQVKIKERKFECNDCGLRFYKRDKLKLHHDTVHKGLKPFDCTECGKKFGRKDHLARHVKVHTKVIPVICLPENHCQNDKIPGNGIDENFQKAGDKQRDEKINKNKVKVEIDQQNYQELVEQVEIKGRKFQCDDCGLRFHKRDKLKLHHDTVHKKLRPFECTECGKKFGRKDHLARHIKVHTKEGDFSQMSDFIEHNKTIGGDSKISSQDETNFEEEDSVHSNSCEDNMLPTFIALNDNKISDKGTN